MSSERITDLKKINLEQTGQNVGRAIKVDRDQYREIVDQLNDLMGMCFNLQSGGCHLYDTLSGVLSGVRQSRQADIREAEEAANNA
jgi:hypothetical protein